MWADYVLISNLCDKRFIYNLQSQRQRDRLSCYYNRNRPTQVLRPVKVETLNSDPDLYLFHDVISESEIELIKKLAKPQVIKCFFLLLTIFFKQKFRYVDQYGEVISNIDPNLRKALGIFERKVQSAMWIQLIFLKR